MFIKNRLGLIESVETMLAQTQRLNEVSNNVANVDTSGYKKDNVTFWEMLYTTSNNQQRVGKALRVTTEFQAGPVEETGNPLDLALNGEGFFKIQTPQGVRYTRDGNFHLNSQGQITTADGNLLLGQSGPIVVQGKKFVINPDGNVIMDGEQVNQVSVVTFSDLKSLEKEGNTLFRTKSADIQEQPAQGVEVKQGFLEGSNVNVVKEMTDMMDLFRSFEAQQRTVNTINDMDSLAVSRVGKLTP